MVKTAIFLAGSVVLAGCVSAPGLKVEQSVSLSPAEVALIHANTRSGLKDPESARFGSIIAGRTPSGVVLVCGLVNARNSFGGYTGMQPFSGVLGRTPQGPAFALSGVGEDMGDVCRANGLALT